MRACPTSAIRSIAPLSRLRGQGHHGFTLIEILLVVAILSILVVLAIPSYYGSRRSTMESSALAGLKSIAEAEEMYYHLNNFYPGGKSEDHFERLRAIDALDPKAYGRSDSVDGFIKGYSINFFSNGPYPQAYSLEIIPVQNEMGLRTFTLANGMAKDTKGFRIW